MWSYQDTCPVDDTPGGPVVYLMIGSGTVFPWGRSGAEILQIDF